MSLPKIDVPTYELKLISTGKSIRFRPFLVKEQKLFFMASESPDPKETINVIKQVLKNCILDDINIDDLPVFDLEYVFVNLRARSVEEIVNLKYKCNNIVGKDDKGDDKKCNNVVEFDVNLLDIKPIVNPEHSNKFQLTENLGICLKYPTFEMIEKYEGKESGDVMLEILTDCIDYLYDKDQIYYAKDSTKEELREFVDNLQQRNLEKIQKFFETVPELKKEVEFKCNKCEYAEKLTIKGIENFFG
jgi:hypothetical protein